MLRCLMQYNIFSIPTRGLKTKFVLYVGFHRESRIFRLEVLGTKDVTIGPLEYCGVGMIIKMTSGDGY